MTVAQMTLDQAWDLLESDPMAMLIDVRTRAEWNFVGLPELSSIGKQVRTVEWVSFPAGSPNPSFVEAASDGVAPDQAVLLLCRSGGRSLAAGQALVAAGFQNVINVVAGFEGDLDTEGHRHGGWKDALPWRQS